MKKERKKTLVIRLNNSLQQRIFEYINQSSIKLVELIEKAVDVINQKYSAYLNSTSETNDFSSSNIKLLRIGTTVSKDNFQKLYQISKLTSRSITDLVTEGIWEVINEQNKNK